MKLSAYTRASRCEPRFSHVVDEYATAIVYLGEDVSVHLDREAIDALRVALDEAERALATLPEGVRT